MQRYLHKILGCALDRTPELRHSAFEVVASIMNQGLAHPVLVSVLWQPVSGGASY